MRERDPIALVKANKRSRIKPTPFSVKTNGGRMRKIPALESGGAGFVFLLRRVRSMTIVRGGHWSSALTDGVKRGHQSSEEGPI